VTLETESPIRHEYLDGEIYAMAGGSPDHAALAATVIGLLRPQLPDGCRAFTSDLRVRISVTGLSTYPDIAVVCGPTARAADDPLAVVNPIVLVEVTAIPLKTTTVARSSGTTRRCRVCVRCCSCHTASLGSWSIVARIQGGK